MNAPSRPKLIVVGNGMAGMRTVEELLALAPSRYDITVFGAEPHPNYNRILLSSVLAGEKSVKDIVINSPEWYRANGIALHVGDPVVALDARGKTVTAASGLVARYDQLLLATGSKPLMPPVPGMELPGVVTFRDIADVEKMLAAAQKMQRAVVIGGGLLGLEAAWGLKRRGMPTAVVHLMDTLMERQLDAEAGHLLRRELTERGLHFFLGGQTEEVTGTERAEGLKLADGRTVPADLVVVAIGIRPNIDLARKAGLEVNRGVVVGDDMRTSDADIYSVGECVEHRGQVFGLVAPLWEQAKICARRLAGETDANYVTPALSTRLKITGIDVFSAGQLAAQDEADEELIYRDSAKGIYRKLVLRESKVVGAVMYGDVGDGAWFYQLMRDKADVAAIRDRMIFGQAYADVAAKVSRGIDVAAIPESAQVCGCNGVSKGAIVAAIQEKGLTSLDEVKAHTKASAGCGQCAAVVQSILAQVTGEVVEAKISGLCACTDLPHDAVRREIVAQNLKTMSAVRGALGWRSATGCAKCRPALNYYLLCAWPAEYVDDGQSRFVNERVHANIQKDGTYSVVPRLWGGVATPAELRAIADVAEKHRVPTVKLTGGQRIDLLGVRKDQLPAIWADLNAAGLISGHAYAKGLRTVKTCVGSEWCRFGTQDSTKLGIRLERLMWGSWTPHKVKLAVSGCPRNCAEATIKDIGVICVEAGYDIVVGGNGGIELRGTDHLTRVGTEDEVLEFAGAFLQIYREEARYLERTAPWVERVGMDYVRKRVVADAAGRAAAYARFLFSQKYAQIDPWAERIGGTDAHEFRPLAEVV
ncbi:MAG: NAD(P)/FAD-dependent oxidoreductase [Rhodospirillales bacterium]|nr:NAD(P)/FAD-dependent oxidoreductase [Rhodospirillales bacterium]